MNTIKYLVQLSFMCFACIGFAQRSAIYSHETVRYNSALSLYNTQQFQTAQLIFQSVESSTSDFFLNSSHPGRACFNTFGSFKASQTFCFSKLI